MSQTFLFPRIGLSSLAHHLQESRGCLWFGTGTDLGAERIGFRIRQEGWIRPRMKSRLPGLSSLLPMQPEPKPTEETVRHDRYSEKGSVAEFPVFTKDTRVVSSTSISEVLGNLPLASFGYVFIDPSLQKSARKWLDERRIEIIQLEEESS